MNDGTTTEELRVDTIQLEWTLRPEQEQRSDPVEPGNVPRVSRLMALAIKFDGMIRRDEVQDCATLARLGVVTRARMTQIMSLLNLAPDIQEQLLFLPRTVRGRDPVTERDLRPIAAEFDWDRQREMWAELARERLGEGLLPEA